MAFLGSLFKKKQPAPASPGAQGASWLPVVPLPAEVPPNLHRVPVVRFENEHQRNVNWRELVLDGQRLLESAGYTSLEKSFTHVSERFGVRFETADEARAAFEQRAAQRGAWARVVRFERDLPSSKWLGAPEPAVDPQQEAVLDAAVGEAFDAAARVYADWLLTRGDPRGELAALLQAGGTPDAFLAANGEALFGILDVTLGAELAKLEWQAGFLRGACLKRYSMDSAWALDELTATFLALPVARFVTSLRFGLTAYESNNDWGSTLAAVAASPRAAALRVLAFDFYDSTDSELSWTPAGSLGGHWSKFPVLETLVVRAGAGGSLGRLELPSLKKFVRESGFPVHTSRCSSATQLTPLFSAAPPKRLRHFGLVNCPYVAEAWPALLASRLMAQLVRLDLSKGVLGDDNLELLLGAQARLGKLESLDLRENVFSKAGVERLRAAFPNALLDDQRPAAPYRYVAVGE